jgi:hypothetical protein
VVKVRRDHINFQLAKQVKQASAVRAAAVSHQNAGPIRAGNTEVRIAKQTGRIEVFFEAIQHKVKGTLNPPSAMELPER